jgi:hypothetical protein
MDHCLTRGAHVCHFTEDSNDAKAVVLPFIRQGLLCNEFCLFVTGEDSPDDWCFELQAYGVDVATELGLGRLRIIDKKEWRRPRADYRSLTQARKAFRLVPWTRFHGARIVFDAGWSLHPELPSHELCHWEATSTLLYEGLPVRVMCQYDLKKHSDRALDSALRTHPFVLTEGAIIANPYCEAEQILEFEPMLNYSSASRVEVAAMLADLKQAAHDPELSMQAFLQGL